METLRAIALAVPLAVAAAGCVGSAPADDAAEVWLVDERRSQDDWFCESAEDGGWDCVQDPERVANPRPRRLPEPLFAQRGGAEQETPASAPPDPSPLRPSPPQPPQPPQPPDGRGPDLPEDPSLPLYQRLSYQPDRPTALTDLPGSFYAIQVIAFASKEDLEQFIIDNDLPVMSGAVVEKDGELFYALLAGIYSDRETAERAVRSLPEEISSHGPWIRTMESLQAAMERAEQHPGEP